MKKVFLIIGLIMTLGINTSMAATKAPTTTKAPTIKVKVTPKPKITKPTPNPTKKPTLKPTKKPTLKPTKKPAPTPTPASKIVKGKILNDNILELRYKYTIAAIDYSAIPNKRLGVGVYIQVKNLTKQDVSIKDAIKIKYIYQGKEYTAKITQNDVKEVIPAEGFEEGYLIFEDKEYPEKLLLEYKGKQLNLQLWQKGM